jgi:hypothetical protein
MTQEQGFDDLQGKEIFFRYQVTTQTLWHTQLSVHSGNQGLLPGSKAGRV